MKRVLAMLFLSLIATPAWAHGEQGGFGRTGGIGGFGNFGGGHHDELVDLGLSFGFGFGVLDAEHLQSRFESKFSSLQTQYDDGVATGTDFFSSSDYDRILNRTESLSDRYDLFLTGVEHSIDRLGDVIDFTNNDITFFNDLLAKYQADDTISAQKLARIESWINHTTDFLGNKVDSLTEKQTSLQTNLPTYQAFQTDIDTFLTDITAAGNGSASSSSLKSFAALATSGTTVPAAMCEDHTGSLSPATSVPEPSCAALLAVALAGMLWRRK